VTGVYWKMVWVNAVCARLNYGIVTDDTTRAAEDGWIVTLR
jgi:hypothetical protein